ncbi:MAG: SGNH/GDSL hydrolase family protein [Pseudomonadales bacterium]|nr:SGNH/GDSL hydrolase family protein [Pseudomonadales bacterium]
MIKLALIWTVCLFLLPVLILQGIWTRKTALRLPEASGDSSSGVRCGSHIIGLGDSVIAGVGLNELSDALTAQLALKLSEDQSQAVSWSALGVNGERVQELIRRVKLIDADTPDLILISIGVNDVSHLSSLTRWQLDIATLIGDLKEKFNAPIVFLGLPPMGEFPALPQPLRFALGIRAAMLDFTFKQAGELIKDVYWIEIHRSESNLPMAEDGYHPSALACASIAEVIVKHITANGFCLPNNNED